MKEKHTWESCIFDFRKPPKKCDVCGSEKVRYTTNDEIYGKIYRNGGCYLCDSCGAYVGVHDTKDKIPLGRLATKELRELKMQCHSKFDPLWQQYGFKRQDCYGFLAMKLDLNFRETHFGWFDKEYLLKALDILNHLDILELKKYTMDRRK